MSLNLFGLSICCSDPLFVVALIGFMLLDGGWLRDCVADDQIPSVAEVFARVREHKFHPLNADGSFTNDRTLGKAGIADLDNDDWRVRTLSIRDFLRLLPAKVGEVAQGLHDDNVHARQLAASSLGIARQIKTAPDLLTVLRDDQSALVRSQSAISLGQMEAKEALGVLKQTLESDPSRDVRHFCELAIDQIQKQQGSTPELRQAYLGLDETKFEQLRVGAPAPAFTLSDTQGIPWRLADHTPGHWVVLIWVFADWCPVCHSEFRDLISSRTEFEEAGIRLATIECHDTFPCRVMVGQELDPNYWFSKQSFQAAYPTGIWWRHLCDRAGAVGAMYGVDPHSFAVHAEYINRPSTVIVDPKGVVRFAYYGTYWGDRPTVHETLEMINKQKFDFVHPSRLEAKQSNQSDVGAP